MSVLGEDFEPAQHFPSNAKLDKIKKRSVSCRKDDYTSYRCYYQYMAPLEIEMVCLD